ncbi:MAG: GNAT family N-acetyltransferase [Kiritimatiellae bacterium]|jgi:GNAT superfamily N-acetyltransferase|nr:GNAT family N-acetyltransferase [Kiritimatiellia bacterium]
MEIDIRKSLVEDMDQIGLIERIGQEESSRTRYIQESFEKDNVWVIVVEDKVVGYFVFDYNFFFNRKYLSLLYIAESYRDRGIGRYVMNWILEQSDGSLFVSTNLSNARMIHLLRSCGFEDSGVIYNLDKNDPEVVFYVNKTNS